MAAIGKKVVGAIGGGVAAAVAGVGAIGGGAIKVVKESIQAVAEVNPSTLSGATDIIVVEQPDGTRRSSPFHVRFGKFKAVYPKDRIVDVFCNGEQASFCLRLSKTGEAHVLPNGNPEHLFSPLTSPTMSPRQSPPPVSHLGSFVPSVESVDFSQFDSIEDNPSVAAVLPFVNSDDSHDSSVPVTFSDSVLHRVTDVPSCYDEAISNQSDDVSSESAAHLSDLHTSDAMPSKGWLSGLKFWGQHGPTSSVPQINTNSASVFSVPSTNLEPNLNPTSEQLASLKLFRGHNKICFEIASTGAKIEAGIYLWSSNTKIVVSDVDGTITKSDALGQIYPKFGKDWTQAGVVRLLHLIQRNGYETLYVTARHIGYSQQTKDYLRGLQQQGLKLPEGPVITSPDRLWGAFKREVIERRPEVFKMQCFSEIRLLFPPSNDAPFWAGFGNRDSDAASYSSVGVPQSRIYTVNTSGELRVASASAFDGPSSYLEIQEYVNVMFPSLHRIVEQESNQDFNPINFWRLPVHRNPTLTFVTSTKESVPIPSKPRDHDSNVFNNPSRILEGIDDLD